MDKGLKHAPYNKFKGFMAENQIRYSDIGKLIGVSASTVSQKVNGYSDFYLSEQKMIKKKYGATNDIFL